MLGLQRKVSWEVLGRSLLDRVAKDSEKAVGDTGWFVAGGASRGGLRVAGGVAVMGDRVSSQDSASLLKDAANDSAKEIIGCLVGRGAIKNGAMAW